MNTKTVTFRHDVDTSLDKALEIAKLEFNNDIKSTFLFYCLAIFTTFF